MRWTTLILTTLAVLATTGCCTGMRTTYAASPTQPMVVAATTPVYVGPSVASTPTIVVTRRYHGHQPPWWVVGADLPTPSIYQACNGTMFVEEHVWGFPEVKALPAAGSTTTVIVPPATAPSK